MPGLALYDSNGATRAMTVAKDDGVILIFGTKEDPALIAKVLSMRGHDAGSGFDISTILPHDRRRPPLH